MSDFSYQPDELKKIIFGTWRHRTERQIYRVLPRVAEMLKTPDVRTFMKLFHMAVIMQHRLTYSHNLDPSDDLTQETDEVKQFFQGFAPFVKQHARF